MIKKTIKKTSEIIKNPSVKNYFNRQSFDYLLILFSFFLGLYLDWEIIYAALFAFIIWQILYPFPRRILALVSLALLSFLPIMLFLERNNDAEDLAILAITILFMTLIIGLFEQFKGKNRNNEKIL